MSSMNSSCQVKTQLSVLSGYKKIDSFLKLKILIFYIYHNAYQLLLSTASPNPGVSTTVNFNCTPFSFSTTCVVSTCNVISE